MNDIVTDERVTPMGQRFLEALVVQDFDRLQALFAPQVRFRALLPSRVREEQTAEAAAGRLRYWFGEADLLQVMDSALGQVGDLQYLRYRLRAHSAASDWEIVEQQTYYAVQDDHIVDMWLICSGFHPDPNAQAQTVQAHLDDDSTALPQADSRLEMLNLDERAGAACALLTPAIKARLREMASGQVLEVRVNDPTARLDVEAWCQLSGNPLLAIMEEAPDVLRFFVRKK
jgi:TusA-related sulfurtransferase